MMKATFAKSSEAVRAMNDALKSILPNNLAYN
jgi:hypothetical protein